MKLSVIIPVYNERDTIITVLKKVKSVPLEKEIIIVDDGSTDGTTELLKKIQNNNDVKVIFHKTNQGKGSAIRSGLEKTTGDIVIIQDADLEYEPMDYLKLVKPIISNEAKVVYGSRILGKAPKQNLLFHFGVKLLSFLVNLLYGANITDEATCYKAFHISVLKSIELRCKRFEFCPEVTAKILKKGYKIYEVPITYRPRSYKEGKKIKWKDGVIAIWTLIKHKWQR